MSDFDDFVQYQGDGSESHTVGNAVGSLVYRQSPGFAMPLHGGSVTAAAPGSVLSGVGAYSFGGAAAPFVPPSAVGHPLPIHSTPSNLVAVATAMPAARQLAGVRSGTFPQLTGDVLPGPGAGTGAGRSTAAALILAPEGAFSRHAAETTSASVVHDKSDGRPKFTKEDFARKHRTADALSQIDAFKVTAKKDVEHKAGQRMPAQSLVGLPDASSGAYGFGATGIQPLAYQAPALSAVAGQTLVTHDGISQQSLHPVAMPAVWAMASPLGGMAVLQVQQDHQYQQQQQQQQQHYPATAYPSAATVADQSNRHSEHAMLPYVHYNQMAHVGHIAHGPLPGTSYAVNAGDLHNASFSSLNSGVLPTSLTASSTGLFDAFANSGYHANSALMSPASGAPVELASAALAASRGHASGASIALRNAPIESKVQSSVVEVDSLVRATGSVNFSSGMSAIGVESRPVAPASLDDFDDFISYDSPMGPATNLRSSAANYAGASTTHSQPAQASAAFSAQSQAVTGHASPADTESALSSTSMPPVPISDVNRAGRSVPGGGGINIRDLHKPTKIKHDSPMQKVEVIFKRYVDSDPARPIPLSGDPTGSSGSKISRLNKSLPAVHHDQYTGFVSTQDNHRSVGHAPFATDVVNSAETDADFGDFQFLPADSAATAVSARMTAAPTLAPVVGYTAGDDALHNGLHADAQLAGLALPIASSLSATAAALVTPGHSSSVNGQPVARTLNSTTSSVGPDWLMINSKTPFEATIPHQNQLRPQPQHGHGQPQPGDGQPQHGHGQPLPQQQQQSSANVSEAENLSDEFIAFQSFLPSSDQRTHVSSSESLPSNGSQLPHHVAAAHATAAEMVAHPKQSSKAANWMALSDLSEFVESEGTAKSADLMGESSVFDSVLPRVAPVDSHSSDWSMPNVATATPPVGDEPDDFADFAAFQKVEVGSSLTDSTSWHASAAVAPVLPAVSASNAFGLPFVTPDTNDGDWGAFLGPSSDVLPAADTASASVGSRASSVPSAAAAAAASALTGYDGLFGDGLSEVRRGLESNVVLHQRNEAIAASVVDLTATLPNSIWLDNARESGGSFRASDRVFEAAHVHSSRVSTHNNPVATAVASDAASAASSRGGHVGGDVFYDDNGYDLMQPPPLDDYEHDYDGDGGGAITGANVDEEEEEVYDIAFGGFASYVGTAAQSGSDPSMRQRTTAAQEVAARSATAGADTNQGSKQHRADSVDPVCASPKRSADRDEIAQANASVADVGESTAAAITPIVSSDRTQTAVDKAGDLEQIDEGSGGGPFSLNHATFRDAFFVAPSSQQSAASECAADGEFAECSAVRENDAAQTGGCSSSAGDGSSSSDGATCTAAIAVVPGANGLRGRSVASGASLASSVADTSGRQNDLVTYDNDDSSSESWGFAASPPPLPPADPSADDDDDWGLTARAARDRSTSPTSSADRDDSASGWAEFRAAVPGLSDRTAAVAAAVTVADSPFGTADRSYNREPPALADIDESSSDGGWDDLHSAAAAAAAVEPPADDSSYFAPFFTSTTAAASVVGGGGTVAPPVPDQSVGDRVDWLSAADDASSSTGWASEWAAAAATSSRSAAAACGEEPERLPAATGLPPPPLAMKLSTSHPPDYSDDDDGGDEWEFSAVRLPAGADSAANGQSPETTAARASDVQQQHVRAADDVDDDDDDEEWSFGQPVPTVTTSPADDDWAFQHSGSPVDSAAAAAAADAPVAVSSTGADTTARSTVKGLPTSIPQTATLKVLQIAFAASAAVQWASLTVAASGLPRTVGSSLKTCRLWTRLCDLDSSPAMTDVVWSSSTGCRRMLDTLPLAEVSLGRQSSSAGECSPFGSASRSESRAGMLMPVSLAPTRTAGGSSSNTGTRAKESTVAAAAAAAAGGSSHVSTASSTLDPAQPQRHQRSSDAKASSSASPSDSDWMFADPVLPDLTTGTVSTAASLVPAAAAAAAQFDLDFLESLSSTTSRPSLATDSGSARQPSLPSNLDLSFFEGRSTASGRSIDDSKAGLKHIF